MPELNPAAISASPGTPYVTPSVLTAAPTGIIWTTIGPGPRPNPQEQFDEILNLCRRATSMIDGYCNQPLRATIDNETLYGPGDLRFQMSPNGNARLLLSRSPVTQVLGGVVSMAASFPPQNSPIPASSYKIEKPLLGLYGATVPGGSDNSGQAVLLAPGIVSWLGGRNGYSVTTVYVNGWPHGSLQAPVVAGDTAVEVDDCTGWGPPADATVVSVPPGLPFGTALGMPLPGGATGTIYDPGDQETITVLASSAQAGPGTLVLASPLAYPHAVGTMVSTLPSSVIQSAILYCVAQALIRGATATSIQASPGAQGAGGGEDLAGEAELLIHPYKRIILGPIGDASLRSPRGSYGGVPVQGDDRYRPTAACYAPAPGRRKQSAAIPAGSREPTGWVLPPAC